jgi:signal transduction histidine kinase
MIQKAKSPIGDAIPVTIDNFNRAESDMYFSVVAKEGGFGKFTNHREVIPIDKQTAVRANRDALYSSGVFDLDAGPVTITMPDAGKRFMSLLAIDEDQYAPAVFYGPGKHTFTKNQIGTRYMLARVRMFVDPADPQDVQQAHALQDAIKLEQAGPGQLEVLNWDPVSQKKVRDALLVLASTLPDMKRAFGPRGQVDEVRHLIGTASAWGSKPDKDALRSQLEVRALASRMMLSQEDERRSLARELHDDIGQRLSMVTSQIHLLNSDHGAAGQPRLACLDRLAEELDTLVTDLHNLSHRLHSSKLQHLGVKFALQELCRRMSYAGLYIDLSVGEGLERLREEAAICLLRIAQEALNNVLKHSGVKQAVATLSKASDGYYLTIRDEGKGFNTEALPRGLGLISMRERVRSLQGRLTVYSRQNQGTEIVVCIPLNASVNP